MTRRKNSDFVPLEWALKRRRVRILRAAAASHFAHERKPPPFAVHDPVQMAEGSGDLDPPADPSPELLADEDVLPRCPATSPRPVSRAEGEGRQRASAIQKTADWVGTEKSSKETTPNDPEMTPDDREFDPETLAELQRLAWSEPRSGREAVAKVSALRTLERMRRGKKVPPSMPEGWHPNPGTMWERLDESDSAEVREFWWENLLQEGRL
jgi:hypothetical protein